ncbi:MAG TPA: hypothetical protein VFF65_11335 [Phycisphaerales bacterium]|nr:hypothetical protein [Phycisphaerales bacterium]
MPPTTKNKPATPTPPSSTGAAVVWRMMDDPPAAAVPVLVIDVRHPQPVLGFFWRPEAPRNGRPHWRTWSNDLRAESWGNREAHPTLRWAHLPALPTGADWGTR